MLDGLQAGRAVAAVLVVFFHANMFILPQRLYDGTQSWPAFNMGYAGVEFFFVLSGFIMHYVHARDYGRPERIGTFLTKRFVRIYPIYWIVLAGLIALYFLFPGRGPEDARDPWAILVSFLLLPHPEEPILQVAWTLRHELLFYGLFTLFLVNVRLGWAVFVAWMAGCFFVWLAGIESFPASFFLSEHNILFSFGIIAAMVHERLQGKPAFPVFLAGTALFLAVGLSEAYGLLNWDFGIRTLLYGIGASMAVAGLAAGAISTGPLLRLVGDASYSVYLVHLPAMTIGTVLFKALGAPWGLPPLLTLLLMSAYATAVGVAVHLLLEKPVLARLKPRRRALTM